MKLFIRVFTGDKRLFWLVVEVGRDDLIEGEGSVDAARSVGRCIAEVVLRERGFSEEGREMVTLGAGVLLRGRELCARRLS